MLKKNIFHVLFLIMFTPLGWANETFPQQWLNLLHYQKTLWEGYLGQADGERFYLSHRGKNDPQAEWDADVVAMKQPVGGNPNQHAQCLFPARYSFLKSQTNIPPIKNCPDFEAFKKKVNLKNVSLVFSSYYINTPASTFGHTLLRLGLDDAQNANELLDHAFNYAAVITTTNALVYAIGGILGAFEGNFALMPYFYKIREYNDYEARDLWDYELNLTAAEKEMLVAHIWEMRTTYFDYYYFTENCSYHMLSVLDAVNPHWQLAQRTPWIVLPVDTVKVLADTPGLVKKITFRPSLRKRFEFRLNDLSDVEKKELKTWIKNQRPSNVSGMPANRAVKLLDAAIDYLDYRYAKQIMLEDSTLSRERKAKSAFLLERSKIPVPSPEPNIIVNPRFQPHHGHDSRRLGYSLGHSTESSLFQTLEYRFALHDLLDAQGGSHPQSILEMGRFRFRHNLQPENGNARFLPEDLAILNVTSVSPLRDFFHDFTWHVYLGGQTIRDVQSCGNCFAPKIELTAGPALTFGPFLTYFLFGPEVAYSSKFSHHRHAWRVGLVPELTVLAPIGLHHNLQLRARQGFYPWEDERYGHIWQAKWRYNFHPRWATELQGSLYPGQKDLSLGLFYYY
ncbi:MAG: DUF4105 domain-containing protein [Pseudomonadota bacterium]